VFHHARPATIAVSPVAIAMIESALGGSLVAATTLAQRAATLLCPARLRAVAIAAVTPRAEEEHLATPGDRANDEAERVHVPTRGTDENLNNST